MGNAYVLPSLAAVVGGTSILGCSEGYGSTVAGAITIVLPQNTLQFVGICPADQQGLYGLIVLLVLFVYGRGAHVREANQAYHEFLQTRTTRAECADQVEGQPGLDRTLQVVSSTGRHLLDSRFGPAAGCLPGAKTDANR